MIANESANPGVAVVSRTSIKVMDEFVQSAL